MRKILSLLLLQSSQGQAQERKPNFVTLFVLWYWCKERDTNKPRLRSRKRKTKTSSFKYFLAKSTPI